MKWDYSACAEAKMVSFLERLDMTVLICTRRMILNSDGDDSA